MIHFTNRCNAAVLESPGESFLARLRELSGLDLQQSGLDIVFQQSLSPLPISLVNQCRTRRNKACFLQIGQTFHYAVCLNRNQIIGGSLGSEQIPSWPFARNLFSLAVDRFVSEQFCADHEEELSTITEHLSVVYEQLHTITHLAGVLKLSIAFEDVIQIFEQVLAETLNLERVFYLQLTEDLEQMQASTNMYRVDLDTINQLQEQLTDSTKDVVFASHTELPDFLCTRVKSKGSIAWMVCVPTRETIFGSEEAQFMLTISRMMESHLLNKSLFEEKDLMQIAFVRSLISTLDARDHYTQGHSTRVAEVAADLAKRMGLSDEEVEITHTSGLLHDIGKIGISDNVLRKTGQLSESDWMEIKRHPVIGYEILAKVPQFQSILPGIRHHHERVDGKGYPDGLKASELTIIPRILAVADAFDAMSSDRLYRIGMSPDKVDCILAEGAGTQWDAAIVDIFLKHRDEIRERWRSLENGKNSLCLDL